jgi:hypothetical protein
MSHSLSSSGSLRAAAQRRARWTAIAASTATTPALTTCGGTLPRVRLARRACWDWLESTDPLLWWEKADSCDCDEKAEAIDIDDAIEPTEQKEKTLPNDATEAALPMDSTESCEQIESTEFSDHSDHMPRG